MNALGNLPLPDRSLAVYVDDTGHEAFATSHLVYGLGGCAAMGCDLNRILWQPWREIRKRVTGSPDKPLHANKFSALSKGQEDMEAVARFFRDQPFPRFGAVISINTRLADDLGAIKTIKEVLQARINEIIQPILCREVKVIFESSDRADKLINESFQYFELRRGWKRIPSECYFMPKASADPALEVADFIMHAVGRQARQNLKDRRTLLPDFGAVFHAVDRQLVSFCEVESVTKISHS